MARKKKNKSRFQRNKSTSLQNQTPEALKGIACQLLEQRKFKEAVNCCKQLVKHDDGSESLELLEHAFTGRVKELGAQALVKEALSLLDVMKSFLPNVETELLRLPLLFQCEKFSEAAHLYSACYDKLQSEQRQHIETLFGALFLDGLEPGKVVLPPDSQLTLYYPHAEAALTHYCAGQKPEADKAIKLIPIRSPYRDLRIVLSGLMLFESDREKAMALLEKVDQGSPYYGLIAPSLINEDISALLNRVSSSGKEERKQLREQYGLAIRHFRALEDLVDHGIRPLALAKIVRQHAKCFTVKARKELLRNIIPYCGESSVNVLRNCPEFNQNEKKTLVALSAEKDGAFDIAIELWEEYYQDLTANSTTNPLELALILRKLADLYQIAKFMQVSMEFVIKTLLKSLEFDPDHVKTWLDAARLAQKYTSAKQYYRILNQAIEQLPDSVPVLLAAMKASGERNAHKKAAGLAERVLRIDPINTAALDFLVESRFEHARKLAHKKKWALAEKELQGAGGRVTSLHLKGRQNICLGMLSLLQGNKEACLHYIEAGCEENGIPLLGRILACIEARLFAVPGAGQKAMDKELKNAAKRGVDVDRTVVLQLISWLKNWEGAQKALLVELSKGLNTYFSRGAELEWKPKEGLLLCKAMEKLDLLPTLAKYARKLKKQHPGYTEFEVWEIIAKLLKAGGKTGRKEMRRLERLLDKLHSEKKHEFLDDIEEVLYDISPYWGDYDLGDLPAGFIDSLIDDDPFIDEDFYGPFTPPKKMSEETKKKPQSSDTKKPQRKQLNLFDFE